MSKRWLSGTTAALILLTGSLAWAQIVNVQSLLMKEAPPGLTLSFVMNGDVRQGNVEYVKAGGSIVSYFRRGSHRILVTGKVDYASMEEQSFIKETFEHARWRWWLGRDVGMEFFVQHGYKPQSRIAMRALAGAGIPFTALMSSRWLISGAADIMLERDEYSTDLQYGDSGKIHDYVRLDAFLTVAWTPGRTKTVVTGYFQPVIDDFSNIRVLVEGSLVVDVTKRLALSLTASYSHDTVSPEGTSPYDFRLIWSVRGHLGPYFANQDK